MADPNNILLPDHRLVLALPAKNATTTIKYALCRALGVSPPTDPDLQMIHREGEPFHYIALDDAPPDCAIVGVVRDPMARAISAYRYYWPWIDPRATFEEFLDAVRPHVRSNIHVRAQVHQLSRDGQIAPTAWTCVETLEEDWAHLCRTYGWPIAPLPRINASDPVHRPATITPACYTFLEMRYTEDLVLYGLATGST